MKWCTLIDWDYVQLNLDYKENCTRYYEDNKEHYIGKQLSTNNNVIYFKNRFSNKSKQEIRSILHSELKFLKDNLPQQRLL